MTAGMQEQSVVATFETHSGAEGAIKSLQKAGIDMKQLSIIGKDFHTEEHALGFYTSGDRIKVWGGRGVFWGSLWGLLFGGAFLFVPGVGPLVAMGPLVGWLLGALEGAAVGGVVGALGAALLSVGVPEDAVMKYVLDVKAGKFIVLASGDSEMVGRARALLGSSTASHVMVHAPTCAAKATRDALVARDGILNLLSDDEVARVSMSEAGSRLAEGDEYVDLEQLERGVQRADGVAPLSRLIPKSAVLPETWTKVVTQLARPS